MPLSFRLGQNQYDEHQDQRNELEASVKMEAKEASKNREAGGYIPVPNVRDSRNFSKDHCPDQIQAHAATKGEGMGSIETGRQVLHR